MDLLTKHAQSHGEIFEALAFFKKAIAVVEKDNAPDFIKKISRLFEGDIIEHLKTEENEVFSIVLARGTLAQKRIIRSLQREHINVLEKIDCFKDFIRKYGLRSNEAWMKELSVLSKGIIELMLTHSRREDKELFPLLKDIGCRIKGGRVRCR